MGKKCIVMLPVGPGLSPPLPYDCLTFDLERHTQACVVFSEYQCITKAVCQCLQAQGITGMI